MLQDLVSYNSDIFKTINPAPSSNGLGTSWDKEQFVLWDFYRL